MPNQEVMREWVNRLRSGDYTQGRGKLSYDQDGVRKHCCLGVLSDIAVEQGISKPPVAMPVPLSRLLSIQGRVVSEMVDVYMYDGGNTTMPSEAVYQWAGIPSEMTLSLANADPLNSNKLAQLNDSGTPFAKIADIIEEEWIDLPEGTQVPDSPAAITEREVANAG